MSFKSFFRDYFLIHTLQRMERSLTSLHEKVDSIIMKESDIEQLVSDINDATNRVSERIDAQVKAIKDLSDQLATGGVVTQAQLDAIAAALTTEKDRLTTLGANPVAPIPPTV